MTININNKNNVRKAILYKDLSFKLQGIFFAIRNELGSGYKEKIYQKALENYLRKARLNFQKEFPIKVYSSTGEFLGLYKPDFLVEDKIIIEIKAKRFLSKQEVAIVYDYLRNSKYEVAYLVNFGSKRFYFKRLIFTNDLKKWIKNTRKK
jgi:GxxExxY protein